MNLYKLLTVSELRKLMPFIEKSAKKAELLELAETYVYARKLSDSYIFISCFDESLQVMKSDK
ncbi:MAG: hypothetical protein ACRCX2_18360 [Paraclostridium sp.]